MTIEYKFSTWKKHHHELMAIRHAVFILEQNVPEDLEIDGLDDESIHILALDGTKPVGTARLLMDGHIGRMCVLKDYRFKGIATELLNRLISKAQQQNIKIIKLHAQLTAIPFYEKTGFRICSDVFLDAGIEHKTMQLKIPRIHSETDKLTIEINHKALCQETLVALVRQATQYIAIFTQDLEYELYHQTDVCLTIKRLIRKNRMARIRIICKESRSAAQKGHCFINLAQNFSSFVEIRKIKTQEFYPFQQSWLLIDDLAYCHIKHRERFIGTASFNQRRIVRESLKFFNHAWENSETDQQTRRLSL